MNVLKAILTALLCSLALLASDCIDSPCSGTTNFTYNLAGVVSGDPWCASGTPSTNLSQSETRLMSFQPPAGYSTRIVRLTGELLAWPGNQMAPGKVAGVLLGIGRGNPGWVKHADPINEDEFVFLQDAVAGRKTRAAFDRQVLSGSLPGDSMYIKGAVFCNDSQTTIHMEATFTVVYQFELTR